MKNIGPTFSDELKGAGISLDGIAWGTDGSIQFHPDVPQATRDAVLAVYAAHNPALRPLALADAGAFAERQAEKSLDDLSRAIDAGDTAGALRLVHQLLQEK